MFEEPPSINHSLLLFLPHLLLLLSFILLLFHLLPLLFLLLRYPSLEPSSMNQSLLLMLVLQSFSCTSSCPHCPGMTNMTPETPQGQPEPPGPSVALRQTDGFSKNELKPQGNAKNCRNSQATPTDFSFTGVMTLHARQRSLNHTRPA